MLDAQLANSIAERLSRAPRHVLHDLADSACRKDAAAILGDLIGEMTIAYPELVEPTEPPLSF